MNRMGLQREANKRWWMLLLLSLSLLVLTLNWFDVAAAFPQLQRELHLSISNLTNLIALFILGFAVFHLPAGLLAYRIGAKKTLLLGLLLESLGGMACAFATSYGWMLLLRFLTGAGASFLVGMTLALITSWFRGRELALALGIAAGACFTAGMALALFGWVFLIQTTGWSIALFIGGAIGVLIFVLCLLFLRVPRHEAAQLAAGQVSWKAVGRIVGDGDLWLVGLSFFGVYGAGLAAQQLLPTYLGEAFHLPTISGGLIAAIYVLMSIPGSLLGGWLADRSRNVRAVFALPWVVFGLTLPFASLGFPGIWMMVLLGGMCPQFGFAAWSAVPGYYRDRVFPQDVATAEGLLLTLGGLGGVLIPPLFGLIEARGGFPPAFLFGGGASIIFALLAFAACEPKSVTTNGPGAKGGYDEEQGRRRGNKGEKHRALPYER